MPPYSIYVHVPFCRHRCGYCDFNTYAGLDDLIPAYTRALQEEIRIIGEQTGGNLPVHTIFFGGGTPSLLPAASLETILTSLESHFAWAPEMEISLEANPGVLDLPYLQAIRALSVNRLSLGMQSASPDELRLLERQHTYPDVIQAVSRARRAGFEQINLDLIFGLPEQPLQSWQRSLELALGLSPEHFALYALTMEHGTPFGHWHRRGLLSPPDPDLGAEMYEWAAGRLDQAGYIQYEISNWARRKSGKTGIYACEHNLQYWRSLPYLGLGAGAHGFAARKRTVNVLAPAAYIRRLSQPPGGPLLEFPATPATQSLQPVDRDAEIAETMMMGLRLTREGVSDAVFQDRFGVSLNDLFAAPIKRLVGLGLLEWAGERKDALRLTAKGRLLGNQVFVEFI